MNRFLHFLLVAVFTATSFASFAQSVKQTVAVNSIHRYKMGEEVSTSKYLWRVTKQDGTDAEFDKDFTFVVSYSDDRTVEAAGLDPIAYAGNDGDMMNFSLSEAGQNVVFIKWLVKGDYNIAVRVFDASSGCTDDTYNEKTYGLIRVGDSPLEVSVKWDLIIKNGADAEDCAADGNNVINYTLSIKEHRAPADLDGATPADIEKCTWKYKYEYIVTDSPDLPEASAAWTKGEGTSGVAGENIVVEFDVAEYKANDSTNKSAIQVQATIPHGGGQQFVWVKITDVRDGFSATYEGDAVNMYTRAVINQLPIMQEIQVD